MENFLALVTSNGIEGFMVGLIVLVVVFALSASNVVVSGDQKRVANMTLSILLAGVSIVNPQDSQVIVSAIASISSALMFEFIQFLYRKQAERKLSPAK